MTLINPCRPLFRTIKKHQDAGLPGKTPLFGPPSWRGANRVGDAVLLDLPLGNW